MRYKYGFEDADFGCVEDSPMFLSMQLCTYGNTLAELLENAHYWLIDQDGGERGDQEAQDDAAQRYITRYYFEELAKENLVILI